jgi:hypothetical protein
MESKWCKCGRKRRSPGQRNCRACHAEAQRRYRGRIMAIVYLFRKQHRLHG